MYLIKQTNGTLIIGKNATRLDERKKGLNMKELIEQSHTRKEELARYGRTE